LEDSGNYSSTKFQQHAHDKYFGTRQSDIEPESLPGLHILRETETRKIEQKLRRILEKDV
jgi:hypothetical protein